MKFFSSVVAKFRSRSNDQLIDDGNPANGDGLLQRGESLRLRVNVQNVGPGPAFDPVIAAGPLDRIVAALGKLGSCVRIGT